MDQTRAPNLRTPGPRTDRTNIRRHPERGVPTRIEEFLRAGLIADVAYVENGEPRVIPFLYHYDAGHLYLHGSPGSATLRALRDGRPVAVSVVLIDGLIASRTAPDHSANYRSVVVYGRAHRVADPARKRRVLESLTERYFPGRHASDDYEPATDDDLIRMELLAIEVDEAQAKMREGGPLGPHDSDADYPGSAFIRPIDGRVAEG